MKNIIIILLSFIFFGCSTPTVTTQPLTIEKDYLLRDASDINRPIWISETEEWTKQQQDKETYVYFSFETSLKNDREVACDLAQASARAEIAHEIATYIEKSLGSSKEGSTSINPNSPETKALMDYVEVTMTEKSKAMTNGVRLVRTYWEQRNYLEKKGAKKDYIAFTCAALIKIEKDRLKQSIEEASQKIVQRAADPEVKENVKKALKEVSEKFEGGV